MKIYFFIFLTLISCTNSKEADHVIDSASPPKTVESNENLKMCLENYLHESNPQELFEIAEYSHHSLKECKTSRSNIIQFLTQKEGFSI